MLLANKADLPQRKYYDNTYHSIAFSRSRWGSLYSQPLNSDYRAVRVAEFWGFELVIARPGNSMSFFTQKPCGNHSKRLNLDMERVLGFVPSMFQGRNEKEAKNSL